MDTIQQSLLSQMESTWNMIRDAIKHADIESWYTVSQDFSYAQRLYHLIETWEFYIRDSPQGMEWGHLINLPRDIDEGSWGQVYYTHMQQFMHPKLLEEYLDQIIQDSRSILKSISEEDLYKPDGFQKWIPNRLVKYLYLLRHSMWHLGELSHYNRVNDHVLFNWV